MNTWLFKNAVCLRCSYDDLNGLKVVVSNIEGSGLKVTFVPDKMFVVPDRF